MGRNISLQTLGFSPTSNSTKSLFGAADARAKCPRARAISARRDPSVFVLIIPLKVLANLIIFVSTLPDATSIKASIPEC